MGTLVSAAAALIAGILLGERSVYFPITAFFLAAVGSLVLLAGRRGSERPPLAGRIFLAGFFLWGFFHLQWAVRVPPDDIVHFASGEKMTVIGRVMEPPKFYPRRTVLLLKAAAIAAPDSAGSGEKERRSPVSGGIRLSVYEPEVPAAYGDIVRFTARIKPIHSFANPGGFDYARYIAWRGVRVSAGVSGREGLSKIGEEGNPALMRVFAWRETIRRAMDRSLSPRASAVLQAMVVGTTGGLTPEIRDPFMVTGVTHILSISGSHLGMLAFLVFAGSRFVILRLPAGILLRAGTRLLPSKAAALLTIPPVAFYALLAGGEPATLRSLIMVLIYLAAVLREREGEPLSSLAVAALLVLLHDPRALFDISFQLSYSAVFAMALAGGQAVIGGGPGGRDPAAFPGKNPASLRDRMIRGFRLYLVFSIAVFAATAPLVAYYFNTVSWVGFAANAVVVPLVGNVIVPLGLLSGAFSLAGSGETLPLAGWNEAGAALLLRIVEIFAAVPGAEVRVPSPSLTGLAAIYGALGIFLIWKTSLGRRMIAAAFFLIPGIGSGPVPGFPAETFPIEAAFLDVGQGDAAVLRLGDQVMVIDGGGTFSDSFDVGRSVVAPFLWDRGIDRIDVVAATHPQRDHMEGLLYLLERFPVGEVWVNGDPGRGDFAVRFERLVGEKGIPRRAVTARWGERTVGPCRVRFLNPPGSGDPGSGMGKINDRSLVFRIVCGEISILFTGDIESRGIGNLLDGGSPLESTVLKVPHHGSRGSADPVFVSRICPQVAVISAGFLNGYRHPSPETIAAYRETGSRIHRTDESGSLTLKTDGRRLRFEAARDAVLRSVPRESFLRVRVEEWKNYERVWGFFRG